MSWLEESKLYLEKLYERYNLTESKQVGKLYHLCNLESLKNIINTNTLKGNYYYGVSFSRNKNLTSYIGSRPRSIFQIVLDGDKLSENYKINPRQYRSEYSGKLYNKELDEYEEYISGSIKDVDKYIIEINIIVRNMSFNTQDFKRYDSFKDTDIFTYPYTFKDLKNTIIELQKKYKVNFIVPSEYKTVFESSFNEIINEYRDK